jgi:spore maturation protein CgeB
MTEGETIATYRSADDVVDQIKALLDAEGRRLDIARRGHNMVSTRYSKDAQWTRFEALVASI